MRLSAHSLRHPLRSMLALAVVSGLLAAPSAGQDRSGQRVYNEQLRVKLDEQLPEAREVGVDGGAWFTAALFHFKDAGARQYRTLRQYQIRAWGSANYKGVHQGYVRGLLNWDDWNGGDNDVTWREDEFEEEIERAWYQFDLGRLLQLQQGGLPTPVDFRVKVGRQYATIGTALALSMPLDMIRFDLAVKNWELMAMLGKSIRESVNIDNSMAVFERQDRCFWGVELAYRGFDDHRPFVYFLDNIDHTSPMPRDPFQRYEYSTSYLGIGSSGTVWRPNLRYQTEVVGEWGKTFSEDVVYGRDRVCALAFDALLEYTFDVATHPRVSVEYLFGSGDGDRRATSSATVGGNRAGTKDRAFNAFGFRDTGLAFSPDISNIHIYSIGAACFPLEKIRLFKKMEVGTKAFFYHKNQSSGPVSDFTAINDSQWLGWEWDVYCNWRLTSDVSWTIRYGAFQPGAAFDGGEDECRQFLYTGVTFSF